MYCKEERERESGEREERGERERENIYFRKNRKASSNKPRLEINYPLSRYFITLGIGNHGCITLILKRLFVMII